MTKYLVSSLVLVALIVTPLAFISAFGPVPPNPPACDPSVYPGCNLPINVGTASQVKSGGLSVNALLVNLNAQILKRLILSGNGGSAPTSGQVLEMWGGLTPVIQAYDWDAKAYLPLEIKSAGITSREKIGIAGSKVLEFNYNATAGSKEGNAGKIGYGFLSTMIPALDIVGAGSSVGTRMVRIWDILRADNIISTNITSTNLYSTNLCTTDKSCETVENIINNTGGDSNWSKFGTAILNSNTGHVLIGSASDITRLFVGRIPTLSTGQVPKVIITNNNTANTYDQGLYVQNAGNGWAIQAESTNANKTGLRVDGKVMIADGTQGVGKVLTSNASGVASWQTPTGGGGVGPWTEDSANLKIYTTNLNRKVGIGLTNPSQSLDVSGGIKGTGFTGMALVISDVIQYNNGAGLGKVLTSDASGIASWQTPVSASILPGTLNQTLRHGGTNGWVSTSGMLIDSLGNVGIKSAPDTNYDLKVNGDVAIIGLQRNVGRIYANDVALAMAQGNQVNIGPYVSGGTPGAEGTLLNVNGKVRIGDGTQGDGKVLTSNASGVASWKTVSEVMGGGGTTSGSGTVPAGTMAGYGTQDIYGFCYGSAGVISPMGCTNSDKSFAGNPVSGNLFCPGDYQLIKTGNDNNATGSKGRYAFYTCIKK